MTVRPQPPGAWPGTETFGARFVWRGAAWQLTVDRAGGQEPSLEVDGQLLAAGAVIRPGDVRAQEVHTIRATA